MAKLLLGDDLQHPKFDENTVRQILSLLHSPFETVTQSNTQPQPTTSTQPELVMKVPTSLVTMRPPVPLKISAITTTGKRTNTADKEIDTSPVHRATYWGSKGSDDQTGHTRPNNKEITEIPAKANNRTQWCGTNKDVVWLNHPNLQ